MGAGLTQMGFVTKIPEKLPGQVRQGGVRAAGDRSGLWLARG